MPANNKQKLGDLFRNRRERGLPGLPVMSVTLNDGLVGRDTLDRKTDTNLDAEEHLLIQAGDIAYNMMRMWQGASGLAKHDGVVSPAYVVLAPKNGIDPLFASYWFKSSRMVYLFWAYSYGLTNDRLRLYFKDFAEIPVSVPAHDEQVRIGEILSLWDTAIAQTEKLIEAKRKLKKGLLQQLLTGKRRLLKATDTWSHINLGSMIHCYSGGTPSRSNGALFDGNIPWIKSGELNNKNIYSTEESISEEAVNGSAVKYVYPNTLLYALYGATAGIPAFSRIRATINQAILAIIPNESLNSEYLYYWLLHSRQHLLEKYTQGGQPNLSAQLVKEFEIPVPPLPEQNCIVSVLNTIDQEIETLYRLSERLKRQKRGLMQKLLTGQIRVKATEEITAS